MWRALKIFGLLALLTILLNCQNSSATKSSSSTGESGQRANVNGAPNYTYQVVNSFPHDGNAFTQGLIFYQGMLYESTGLKGASSLRKVDLQTGNVIKKLDVPREFFAEGITIFQNKIYQLTWTDNKGFIYDLDFNKLGEFSYTGEGWGLTHDDNYLILSGGTADIRFLDPNTFEVKKTIKTDFFDINELEYIKGEIYANIWHTDYIVRLDPATGKLLGVIDLAGLLPAEDRTQQPDVLNGIAYDAAADRLFVTGKLWPKLFEIRLKNKS